MRSNRRARGNQNREFAVVLPEPAMKFRLATAAAATVLIFACSAAAFPEREAADDGACTGRAPFREVAQDEMRSFAEICGFGGAVRGEPQRSGTGAVGWAKGRGIAPATK